MRIKILIFSFLFLFFPFFVFGQGEFQEEKETWQAVVVDVLESGIEEISELGIQSKTQIIEVRILEGPRSGEIVVFDNDYIQLKKNDKFFLNIISFDEQEFYNVKDPDRRGVLTFFILFFVFIVIAFGGWQGVRSLMALAGSFLAIFYFLFPALLAGANPLLFSLVVSLIILILAILLTHGSNKKSYAAILGAFTTIVFAVFLANFGVKAAHLSGFVEDASMFLNFETGGHLDFQGLLLGAIIIGVLGMLDDIAITQASVVEQLKKAAPNLTNKQIYSRALVVGREHVGALVNTLVLAYAGASLPLLLYFQISNISLMSAINSDIFATEIIRSIIGSSAIILAVPVSTFIAILLLKAPPADKRQGE